MITFTQKGDLSKVTKFLERGAKKLGVSRFDRYGRMGVAALAAATPVDTGKTAASWKYDISEKDGVVSISFDNTNNQNGVPIVILLQYGHATRNGGWVEGRDFINPAIRPIFDQIAREAWEEVSKT